MPPSSSLVGFTSSFVVVAAAAAASAVAGSPSSSAGAFLFSPEGGGPVGDGRGMVNEGGGITSAEREGLPSLSLF